jgi:hypothetical protein
MVIFRQKEKLWWRGIVNFLLHIQQFWFFVEALTMKRLKSYVMMMAEEAEVRCGFM